MQSAFHVLSALNVLHGILGLTGSQHRDFKTEGIWAWNFEGTGGWK